MPRWGETLAGASGYAVRRTAVALYGQSTRVLERFARQSYLEVEPQTGRTHQIRVHLAYIGHPVVGDEVYGYRKQRIKLIDISCTRPS